MSRVGKKPIQILPGTEVKIEDGRITVKGSKGTLIKEIPAGVSVEIKGSEITVSPVAMNKKNRSLWGLMRMIISNMVEGTSKGFEKRLEMEGVGYRASVQGNDLVLEVGFSHDVKIPAPEGIKFSMDKAVIVISGIDKEAVGQIAAVIRRVRPPEPYKGKGIKYQGEVIKRKLGKKAATSGGGA